LLAIIVIAASTAAVIATAVASFYGIYFFFFFVPLSFGLPWSIKKLWHNRTRKRWNVEDLR
jgi:dolichyl-phosphate-mannose--protein O-mannosyl transferase